MKVRSCKHVKGLFCVKECKDCIDCKTLKRFKKAVSRCYASDDIRCVKHDCKHCDAKDLLQNLIDYNKE